MNRDNMDLTEEMAEPTLPVMRLLIDNHYVNPLQGYTSEMECGYMRDSLTVIGADRSVEYVIETNGNIVTGLMYEVRSLDGSRLVEKTEITDAIDANGKLSGTVQIKDLIEQGQEYMLIFLVNTSSESEIRYYTRLVQSEEMHLEEKLSFVADFHEKTFHKAEAQELTKYLESNSKGDNTTFQKVDIHSSFHQVTWGDLEVRRLYVPAINIRELTVSTGYFELKYLVEITDEEAVKTYYLVSEWYRIRYSKDRMYLLDFERDMVQIFDEEGSVYVNDKILLGIVPADTQLVECEGGNSFAFVSGGKLYSYNVADNKLALLFSFYSEHLTDTRGTLDQHDIRILNVDETGNVDFMVYGYMNRGRHEGRCGVTFYRYNSLQNTVEEEVFLSCEKPYGILKNDIAQLSYLSANEICYLVIDGSVYAINLLEHRYEIVVDKLQDGSYYISDNGKMIVWKTETGKENSSSLTLMNLSNEKKTQIQAGAGEYTIPLGFMGEDVIYGLARESDASVEPNGMIRYPMWSVKIENIYGDVLKEYSEEPALVVGCEIVGSQIILERKVRDEDGFLEDTSDDQIMSTLESVAHKNNITTVVTEHFEKIVQIQVKSEIAADTMKHLTPRQILFEGNRQLAVVESSGGNERFFVYGLKGASGIYREEANAVEAAFESSGVVVNDKGFYIWAKTNRASRNQIMAITAPEQVETGESVAVCLDAILRFEGVSLNSSVLLSRGLTAVDILEQNLPNAEILELAGCSLDSVLYYVDRDIPILALLRSGEALLVTGFNESQVVLFDPLKGDLYKVSMTEAKELFEQNGNSFVTYMK